MLFVKYTVGFGETTISLSGWCDDIVRYTYCTHSYTYYVYSAFHRRHLFRENFQCLHTVMCTVHMYAYGNKYMYTRKVKNNEKGVVGRYQPTVSKSLFTPWQPPFRTNLNVTHRPPLIRIYVPFQTIQFLTSLFHLSFRRETLSPRIVFRLLLPRVPGPKSVCGLRSVRKTAVKFSYDIGANYTPPLIQNYTIPSACTLYRVISSLPPLPPSSVLSSVLDPFWLVSSVHV